MFLTSLITKTSPGQSGGFPFAKMFLYFDILAWLPNLNLGSLLWTSLPKSILRDTSTSSEVSNCDGVVLEIYLDNNFQWPQEDLNCESLAYKVATQPTRPKEVIYL